jgi:uncharacterized protein (DUF433 family)
MMKLLDKPMYPVAFTSRLAKVRPDSVRRWLKGYTYKYTVGNGTQLRSGSKGPMVRREGAKGSIYASFLDLVDLLFIKAFLDKGHTLNQLRAAFKEADELIGGHHFAQRKFFSDGRKIYLQIKGKDSASAIMQLMSGKQWVIKPIIEQLADKIDFNTVTGYAEKWYPLSNNRSIALDPCRSFGKPIIVSSGTPTSTIYDLYIAEDRNLEPVQEWMGLTEHEVNSAVEFEQWLAVV